MSERLVATLYQERDRLIDERDKLKADVERLTRGLKKNFDMQAEWLAEWKRVAEALKAEQPNVLSLARKLEAANAACAEMRVAISHCFSWTHCTVCGADYCEDCAKQREIMEHALSSDCGRDYVHKSQVERLREALSPPLEHDIWKDPEVMEALKDGRTPDDIAVLNCPKCGELGYYNQGSHFSCRFCDLGWVILSEDERRPPGVACIRDPDYITLADTVSGNETDIP